MRINNAKVRTKIKVKMCVSKFIHLIFEEYSIFVCFQVMECHLDSITLATTFPEHTSHNCWGFRSFIIKRMRAWVCCCCCWHSAQMSCIFRSRSFNGHQSRLASSPWQRREKCCSSHSYYFHSLKCPSHAGRAGGRRERQFSFSFPLPSCTPWQEK